MPDGKATAKLTWGEVVIDALEPRNLAKFWQEVTGYPVASETDSWVSLDPGGDRMVLAFQRVPEHKTVKNRFHLDLYTDNVLGEVDRCIGLGATRLYDSQDADDVFVTLADPEGNEFCICFEPGKAEDDS